MTKGREGRGEEGGEAKRTDEPSVNGKEPEKVKAEPGDVRQVSLKDSNVPSGEDERVREEGGPKESEKEEGHEREISEEDTEKAAVSLEERVEQLKTEKEEWQDKFVRLMADFDNFKKRANREKAEVIQFGNESLLKDILPIIDSIERLLTYSYQEGSWKSFQEGIELLLAEIRKTLAGYGVEEVEALGKPFDPNFHEAMQRSETDEAPVNTIVEVFQKGYVYRGRLLRPSLVVVAVPLKGEAEEGEVEVAGCEELSREDGQTGDEDKGEEPPIQ